MREGNNRDGDGGQRFDVEDMPSHFADRLRQHQIDGTQYLGQDGDLPDMRARDSTLTPLARGVLGQKAYGAAPERYEGISHKSVGNAELDQGTDLPLLDVASANYNKAYLN